MDVRFNHTNIENVIHYSNPHLVILFSKQSISYSSLVTRHSQKKRTPGNYCLDMHVISTDFLENGILKEPSVTMI